MDTPIYPLTEAARYVKLAPATLRSWVVGRRYPKGSGSAYFAPLIALPRPTSGYLSFNNLAEAYVLRSLRQEHGVSIRDVRTALDYAQSEFKIKRLLLSPDLLTAAGDLFLRRYGELINLSRSGQMALRKMLEAHVRRIDWESNVPLRLYPFIDVDTQRLIAIDPTVGFGRPHLIRKGISTAAVVSRIDAGESPEAVADDYEMDGTEIELAILYERAA